MSTVSPVNTTSALTSGQTSTTPVLGKDDFMKLLLTQMKYQDPMSPMDGTQFASQLAQFSSLEQLSNLNTNVSNMLNANVALTQSITNTMAANLIGKEVKINSSDIKVNGQSSIGLGIDLSSSASKVVFKVFDSNGGLVKTIEKNGLAKGENKLSWDLTDNNGNKVANGSYTCTVEATSMSGEKLADTGYQYGLIAGIKFSETGSKFVINGNEFDLANIFEIVNAKSN